jgi:predicted ArsR family transcriptional regulator
MRSEDPASRLALLAVLSEPVRRRLYEHVAAQPEPVGRAAAAAAAGTSRRVAAFHLDKLADAGLLEISYRRLGTRRGPGAGRPAKLYAAVTDEVNASVPPRDYELAARVFAGTVAALNEAATATLTAVATAAGHRLAAPFTGPAEGLVDQRRRLEALLRIAGYAPYEEAGDTRLRNCPFHRVAVAHRDLVCTANRHVLAAVAEDLAPSVAAEPDPRPGQCCVVLRLRR